MELLNANFEEEKEKSILIREKNEQIRKRTFRTGLLGISLNLYEQENCTRLIKSEFELEKGSQVKKIRWKVINKDISVKLNKHKGTLEFVNEKNQLLLEEGQPIIYSKIVNQKHFWNKNQKLQPQKQAQSQSQNKLQKETQIPTQLQEIGTRTIQLNSKYRIFTKHNKDKHKTKQEEGKNKIFGFQITDQNFNQKLPLVIDPSYRTYIGGNQTDEDLRIASDSKQRTYITGKTISYNFPTFPENVYQKELDYEGIFIMLFDQNQHFLWSTFFTSSGGSVMNAKIQVSKLTDDPILLVDVFDYLNLNPLPVFENSYQKNCSSIGYSYIFKMNQDGSNLVWSSLLCSSGFTKNIDFTLSSKSENLIILLRISSGIFPPNPNDTSIQHPIALGKLDNNAEHLLNSLCFGHVNYDVPASLQLLKGTFTKTNTNKANNQFNKNIKYTNNNNNNNNNNNKLEQEHFQFENQKGTKESEEEEEKIFISGRTLRADFPSTSNNLCKQINCSISNMTNSCFIMRIDEKNFAIEISEIFNFGISHCHGIYAVGNSIWSSTKIDVDDKSIEIATPGAFRTISDYRKYDKLSKANLCLIFEIDYNLSNFLYRSVLFPLNKDNNTSEITNTRIIKFLTNKKKNQLIIAALGFYNDDILNTHNYGNQTVILNFEIGKNENENENEINFTKLNFIGMITDQFEVVDILFNNELSSDYESESDSEFELYDMLVVGEISPLMTTFKPTDNAFIKTKPGGYDANLAIYENCLSGFYGNMFTECQKCEAGTVSSGINSLQCSSCESGFISTSNINPNQTSCIKCPIEANCLGKDLCQRGYDSESLCVGCVKEDYFMNSSDCIKCANFKIRWLTIVFSIIFILASIISIPILTNSNNHFVWPTFAIFSIQLSCGIILRKSDSLSNSTNSVLLPFISIFLFDWEMVFNLGCNSQGGYIYRLLSIIISPLILFAIFLIFSFYKKNTLSSTIKLKIYYGVISKFFVVPSLIYFIISLQSFENSLGEVVFSQQPDILIDSSDYKKILILAISLLLIFVIIIPLISLLILSKTMKIFHKGEAPKFIFIKSYDWIWKSWKNARIWWSIPQYLFLIIFCLLLGLINSNSAQIISLFVISFIFIISILKFRPYYTSTNTRFSHNELYSIVMILLPNTFLSLFISKLNYLFFSFLLIISLIILSFSIKSHRNYLLNNKSNNKNSNLELNDIQDYNKIDENSEDNTNNSNSDFLKNSNHGNETLDSNDNTIPEENEDSKTIQNSETDNEQEEPKVSDESSN
ncbi:cell surface glycoprotein (s-layer protein)-like protein [Anaeramoeba flamelloides]|uniref:Cell surface glycoprotein (S-layer protein)-like protein n=1 Tax=Anaeramoeba flamelloides TaxID=1746091 RepID=A0ABQ8XSR7_9EUKA|nr:cell surface glycoprotein (s-layer protein)-like protein [Anaeramoeba flamelloides]